MLVCDRNIHAHTRVHQYTDANTLTQDDDTNFHIDYITACSNLRATNYNIDIADR